MRERKGAGEPTSRCGTEKARDVPRLRVRALGRSAPRSLAISPAVAAGPAMARGDPVLRRLGGPQPRAYRRANSPPLRLELGPASDKDPSRGRGELSRPAGASALTRGGATPPFDFGAGLPNSFNGDGRGGLYFSVRGEIL